MPFRGDKIQKQFNAVTSTLRGILAEINVTIESMYRIPLINQIFCF